MITIGQVAKDVNCKVQTIRYYEQIGLLPTPIRNQGNQRRYNQAHLDRVRFIRHSRELGFSLDDIRKILSLSDQSSQSCEEVDRIARDHLMSVESKIERLQSLHKELKRMINECSKDQVADCRIIQVLSNHKLCFSEHE